MRVSDLRCECAENPIGIVVRRPILSWRIESCVRGTAQTAYRIEARDETGRLAWDSGKVESERSAGVEFGGPAPRSMQRFSWTVRVWDQDGKPSARSCAAFFETGLLRRSDWKGRWIGSSLAGGPRTSVPSPHIRKSFRLSSKPESARLYVAVLGAYQAFVNGVRAGDAELAPGWTDFRRRVRYQTFDVTAMTKRGENVVGILLGDGWYCGRVGWLDRQMYGDRPKALAQLAIRFKDGRRTTVVTDASWKCRFGPLLSADIIRGEAYDARLDLGAWSSPGHDDSKWGPVEAFEFPKGLELEAQDGPDIRRSLEMRTIADPVEVKGSKGRAWIFDLGQNMTGRVRIKVRGKRGETVRIRHAEALAGDGSLYTANLRSASAEDLYTLRGGGFETWEPAFTFHGFRYVELSGVSRKPDPDAVTGVVLGTAMPFTGEFECSDPQVNKLHSNIAWSWRGNSLDVPTDCPQRDERLGWTGDALNFVQTACYLSGSVPFFRKWLADMRDAQGPRGEIPAVVPNVDVGVGRDGGPAWADAAVVVPWTAYLHSGDLRLIDENYRMMTRYMRWVASVSPGCIRGDSGNKAAWQGFGDWLAQDGSGKTGGGTPKDLIGTAFYARCAGIMADSAAALGKTADAERYSGLREEVKKAFCGRFVAPDGSVAGGTQTAAVLALAFGLMPEGLRSAVAAWLVRDIEGRGMHLSTGFVGTPLLPFVLSDAGRDDVAYALLLQKTAPSWLYPVEHGATTIWERWDGWTGEKGFQDPGMNSFNHYSFGAVGAWLYSHVAGIRPDPAEPGYKRVVFRPRPGGGLTHAGAAIETPFGRASAEWRIGNGVFRLEVEVPLNSAGRVFMPGRPEPVEVGSGKHVFEGHAA